MTHAMNTMSLTPAGDGLAMVWAAEVDEWGEIGLESACPVLQASLWREAASDGGEPLDLV
jgi:hypothetical protein